ncbi:centrosomal protein of 164 kDa-like isoform X2 [Corticium candelabrum]|uniref:centrosomal protein of 164 kDa-like isoform X2 n=1 Tax=Corticium candelabrum TaxID=121492 RepID=UPI002E262CE0|nr:centrosomal protein of 164 kDa-like isoform X2 [Corticium candelabrum]
MEMGKQVVLQEEYNENYEPTTEELLEYCKQIGLDPKEDPDLMWIAREGLKAPLPSNWKPVKDSDTEDVYYFNFTSGASTWDHPCDEYYQKLLEKEKGKKQKKQKPKQVNNLHNNSPASRFGLQPLKVGVGLAPGGLPPAGLAPLKLPGSESVIKPPLGPLRGIPPLKKSIESSLTGSSSGSALNPLVGKAMTGKPAMNVGEMQLSREEESDDDVSFEIAGKLSQHDIAALGYVESGSEHMSDPVSNRPDVNPMMQSESFLDSESEPEFGLANHLVGLSPDLLKPAAQQTDTSTEKQHQKPTTDLKNSAFTSQVAALNTTTATNTKVAALNVVGNMRYEEEDEEDSDDISDNSEERNVEEARLKAVSAAVGRASIHAEIAKQEELQKAELEKVAEQHHKELEELRGKFQGELTREKMRLEQEKETELNKLRARLNQEKIAEEAKLKQNNKNALEKMKKTMGEEKDDEEARMAEQKQEAVRKINLELKNSKEQAEAEVKDKHKRELDVLRVKLENERVIEERRIKEESETALQELEIELKNRKDSRQAELASTCEHELDNIRKQFDERCRKVRDELEQQHDNEVALLRETMTKEHSQAIATLRVQLDDTSRKEKDRLTEQLEQLRGDVAKNETAARDQMQKEFEMKKVKLEEEHKGQIAACITAHQEKIDAMQKEFASQEAEERTKLDNALEGIKRDGQQAIGDSRMQLEEERQTLLVDTEQQKEEILLLRKSLEEQQEQLKMWKREMEVEEERIAETRNHLQEERKIILAEEKAVGERQTQLNMEKQKMLEERSSLQASLESLHQEVLQLTSKESLKAELEQLSASRAVLLEQQAKQTEEQMATETIGLRPRTSTPAHHNENHDGETNTELGSSEDEVLHHHNLHSQEETMHLTELAAPVARDTLSSYEVVGVSTVLAEQVGEKAGQEKHEPQTSRKQQKLQGLSTSRHQKRQKTSEKRRSRRRTEVVQRVDEPIRDLAARLAVLTSRATTSGRHVKSVRQPLRSDLHKGEVESTVDSYVSSLSSLPTRAIISGSLEDNVEEEIHLRHARQTNILDLNGVATESSGTDPDTEGSDVSALHHIRDMPEDYYRFSSSEKGHHESKSIVSLLHRVNHELSSVLARLHSADAANVPPQTRTAWTDDSDLPQNRHVSLTSAGQVDIDSRWQRYFGDRGKYVMPTAYEKTTSKWTDGSLQRTLLMLEEQKQWLEQYRQSISPQRVLSSVRPLARQGLPEFIPATTSSLRSSAISHLATGRALRYGSSRLELGERELQRVPGVSRSSYRWS